MSESTRCPIAPPEFTRLLELDDHSVRRAPEHFEALRRAGPVTWVDELKSYAVTGYDAATEVLLDNERFSSQLGDPKGPLINSRLADAQGRLAARSPSSTILSLRLSPTGATRRVSSPPTRRSTPVSGRW